MQLICGLAATFLFVTGIIIIFQSIKYGKVFDCFQGSKTEKTWVYRSENPRRFFMIVIGYIIIFIGAILYFSCIASGWSPNS